MARVWGNLSAERADIRLRVHRFTEMALLGGDLAAGKADQVIVLPVAVGPFVLGLVVAELMAPDKVTPDE